MTHAEQLALLVEGAQQLAPDEIAVLLLVAKRLLKRRAVCGPLDVATDEAFEKAADLAADFAVYAAAGLLRSR